MTEKSPRRLKGHDATATCCVASRHKPGFVATSGEDGRVCWFDMRAKDVVRTLEVGKEAISSISLKPGNENIIYVSSGMEVKCFDVNLATSDKTLETYVYNKDEINQVSLKVKFEVYALNCLTSSEENALIACNLKSSFLAAADDSGDVKIIDIQQKCLYKTLRAGHTSICSSVQFLPWKPWEVITGGLDTKLVMWDFSKGRPYNILDFGSHSVNNSDTTGQCFNPAFIHSIAVPDVDMLDKTGKICVVARGDGILDVINIESELAAMKSKKSTKPQKGSQCRYKNSNQANDEEMSDQNGRKRLQLDHTMGGHTAAVSCVSFSLFGERGKFIISGGNDKSVKVWDWCRYDDAEQSSCSIDLQNLNISLSKKVNWLCTTPSDVENLIVCDTTKVVKVFTVS